MMVAVAWWIRILGIVLILIGAVHSSGKMQQNFLSKHQHLILQEILSSDNADDIHETNISENDRLDLKPQSFNMKAPGRNQAHHPGIRVLRENQRIRTFSTAKERALHTHKHRYVEMSSAEKETYRRLLIEETKVCEADEDSSYCFIPGVQTSLRHGMGISWCIDCLDPFRGGSVMDTWEAEHGCKDFHIDGIAVMTVPNDASTVLNIEDIRGNVALVDRGKIPIAKKIRNVQNAGAIAAIVIDSGLCLANFQCGRLGNRGDDGIGFARSDIAHEWDDIHIPTVLIHKKDGVKLKRAMNLRKMSILGFGENLVPQNVD